MGTLPQGSSRFRAELHLSQDISSIAMIYINARASGSIRCRRPRGHSARRAAGGPPVSNHLIRKRSFGEFSKRINFI
jgi:hypothetical protein